MGGGARRVAADVTAGAADGMSDAIPGQPGSGKREAAGCGHRGGGVGAALSAAPNSW